MRSRILLALLAVLTLATAPRTARAEDEVNFDYFYSALQSQGDWFGTAEYGYVFQPRAAAAGATWRPYADGYWSFTDEGWTWVSYEDFGWATYHYGRWAKLSDVGWVWVPGYEWAPAWVSWRSSPRYSDNAAEPETASGIEEPESDYIGWAPLPPEATFDASIGFTSGVDDTYDIGPANYCFVPTRYFGAPVLVAVILPPVRNIFFIGRTVNVTNCSYAGVHGFPRIYCGGPRFVNLHQRVERRIPQLVIERRAPAGVGPRTPAVPGALAFMPQVRGNTLQVTAPRIVPPAGVAPGAVGIPRNASTARPAQLKAEIARSDRVRGWDAPGLPPQAAQAAREQFKREASRAQPRAAAPGATSLPGIARAPASAVPAGTAAATAAPRTPPAQAASRAPEVAGERNLAEQQKRDVARQTQQNLMEQQRRAEAGRQEQLQQQQAADLDRRQRLIAEQQRRGQEMQQQQREALDRQNAMRQQQIEAQRSAQAEAKARIQAQREQQTEQQRQAAAAAQAQRQQPIEAQRQVQADRQREIQAAAQARAQGQAEAARQQQSDAQRRAAEAARRAEAPKGGQATPSP